MTERAQRELDQLHQLNPRMKESVIINPWSSQCGNCGKGCSYFEKSHQTIIGYGSESGTPGCGMEWKYTTTEYSGKRDEEATKACRPDLEFWSPWKSPLWS